jgi:hypothetical protein
LRLFGADEGANAPGDLDLTEIGHTVTIKGADAGTTIIDTFALVDATGFGDRVLPVNNGVVLILEEVEIPFHRR